MPLSDEEARRLLQDAFRSVEEDYRARGIFQDRFGFGRSPALVVVDFAYGWTDEAYAGGSRRLDGPVEATRRLLDAARAKMVPIIYTTSPWRPEVAISRSSPRPTDPRGSEPGTNAPAASTSASRRIPGDLVLEKENASAFFGTHLAPYLIGHGVDTAADHRVQHERVHPRDGHGREELPLSPDHRPRVRRGPLAGRSRVDPVRHPGPVRRCRAARRSGCLCIEPSSLKS